MTYEPTQKVNPYRLTAKQHTFPKTSIARFAGKKGNVDLFLKVAHKAIRVKPSNELFCAARVWDHQAETGFMKQIEDKFQALAGRILDDGLVSFCEAEITIMNEFYCLWNIRAIHKQNRVKDQAIDQKNVVGLFRVYTKDEQEYLEQQGISTIREDYTIAGRFLASPNIKLELVRTASAMGGFNWNILCAEEGEFIVPDNAKRMPIVPLSPTVCLRYGSTKPPKPLERLKIEEVARVNRAAIDASHDYYFARDLSLCPGEGSFG
ncbi:hypothetical protein NLO83_25280 [Pseudomonas tremae]|uniref:hypothetical protein n=1 Tax=Pseudomonas syringae group TaxID=136849 RepID=UPI0001AF600C|nr:MULTISPECIES: hypothetical protein [Pseudomonas syringae group]MCQ3018883.1 hypothetical protein [Pseudomonas tremae]QGL57429.1 hypothetical protein POR16_14325 [Pseudomonas coronafaciens pv. oryzae str. 1_6]